MRLIIHSLNDSAPGALETLPELGPQHGEWVRSNPNTAAAALILSAVHAIGSLQGFEISGYKRLLDYLKALGVGPLAADASSSITRAVGSSSVSFIRSIDGEAERP